MHRDRSLLFLFRAEDESAFDALYVRAFLLLDAEWLKMRASYMEFNVSFFLRVSWSPGFLLLFSHMVVELRAKDNKSQLLDFFASEHSARSTLTMCIGFPWLKMNGVFLRMWISKTKPHECQ